MTQPSSADSVHAGSGHLAIGRPVDLAEALTPAAMKRAWKTVRMGLRSQPVQDLHDFLDVHRTFDAFANRVRGDVLSGVYRPASAEFALLEKRDGITRRLAIPEPRDALLLQCVVEVLESKLKSVQPSPNAYYSKSHTPKSVEAVDHTFAYPWWILWPEFQERIYKFTSTFPFVVIADVANYYDCIPLAALRHTIAACGLFRETLLDFLFFMLEAFSWRPFYIPHSGVGLPQLNFDAPRLLAHAYLFKVDELLAAATDNNFVRWMDDIDAGVPTRESGKLLLRNLELALNRLGLRLNASKSRILSAEEAVEHFCLHENRALTIIENALDAPVVGAPVVTETKRILKRRFKKFSRSEPHGNWDKVYKRYFKLFGTLKDPFLERHLPDLLASVPSLRDAAFRYLIALGYSRRRLQIVRDFVTSGHCEDDVSLSAAVHCLVDWHVPASHAGRSAVVDIGNRVARKSGEFTSSGIIAGLWLISKYGSPDDLMRLIRESVMVWTKSNWAARQVASVASLLSEPDQTSIYEHIVVGGLLNALGVMAHFTELRKLRRLDIQIEPYLLDVPKPGRAYPLYKILIARAVLRSQLPRNVKTNLKTTLIAITRDGNYTRLLRTSTRQPQQPVEVNSSN